MKRLVLLTVLSLILAGMPAASAVAADLPLEEASDASARVAEPEVADPEVADPEVPAPSLEDLLIPPAQSTCSCRDLCRTDAQCALLYGPGSQCVPVGPCQCKECQATM